MVDDRLFGEDQPVDRAYRCPTCDFSAITDTARLCPECGDQMQLAPVGAASEIMEAVRRGEQVWTGEDLDVVDDGQRKERMWQLMLAAREPRTHLFQGLPLRQHAEMASLVEALRERGQP